MVAEDILHVKLDEFSLKSNSPSFNNESDYLSLVKNQFLQGSRFGKINLDHGKIDQNWPGLDMAR